MTGTRRSADKEDIMRKWFERFEAMAVAVTFAESGEWESAKEMMRRPDRRSRWSSVKRVERNRPRAGRTGYRA